MKRGQISIEFITIFGFIFLMTIPLIIIFFDQSGSVQDSISENHLRNIAIKIIDKAETIYYLGEPSKTTLKVYFPERIDYFNMSAAVGSYSASIIIGYRTYRDTLHHIEVASKVNITGNLSVNPGIHYIEISTTGDGVFISD